MTPMRFAGVWQRFRNGQGIWQPYRKPVLQPPAGNVLLEFNTATTGLLTLPDGGQTQIVRFVF